SNESRSWSTHTADPPSCPAEGPTELPWSALAGPGSSSPTTARSRADGSVKRASRGSPTLTAARYLCAGQRDLTVVADGEAAVLGPERHSFRVGSATASSSRCRSAACVSDGAQVAWVT